MRKLCQAFSVRVSDLSCVCYTAKLRAVACSHEGWKSTDLCLAHDMVRRTFVHTGERILLMLRSKLYGILQNNIYYCPFLQLVFKPTDMENLVLRMGCTCRSWFLESGNTLSATLSLYLYHTLVLHQSLSYIRYF